MVEKENPQLSVVQQCILLSICRSSFYYKPTQETPRNLAIMLEIDKIHLSHPYYGVLHMRVAIQQQGYNVSKKLVRRLRRLIGIETMYPKVKTTLFAPGNKIYPYLLRDITIDHCNQVWETDITYIPMKHGFMYLMAVIDVYSRFVLNWGISNTMKATWCKEVMAEAIRKYGKPEIVNTDQGSQFTSEEFTSFLTNAENQISVSMDGRGRATDNIYIERLWRSLKQENIYPKAYETGTDLYNGVNEYFEYYNTQRPHQSIDYQQPEKIYKKVG